MLLINSSLFKKLKLRPSLGSGGNVDVSLVKGSWDDLVVLVVCGRYAAKGEGAGSQLPRT